MSEATLKTGKYTVKIGGSAAQIFSVDEAGVEHWLASAKDLELATAIVEGLILVETKRFYHPDSVPKFSAEVPKTTPSFLQRKETK